MTDQKRTYLERRKSDLEALVAELDQNSFEFTVTLGHRLKGHGDNFGFPDISVLGKDLEAAGKKQAVEDIRTIVQKMSELIEIHLKKLDH